MYSIDYQCPISFASSKPKDLKWSITSPVCWCVLKITLGCPYSSTNCLSRCRPLFLMVLVKTDNMKVRCYQFPEEYFRFARFVYGGRWWVWCVWCVCIQRERAAWPNRCKWNPLLKIISDYFNARLLILTIMHATWYGVTFDRFCLWHYVAK